MKNSHGLESRKSKFFSETPSEKIIDTPPLVVGPTFAGTMYACGNKRCLWRVVLSHKHGYAEASFFPILLVFLMSFFFFCNFSTRKSVSVPYCVRTAVLIDWFINSFSIGDRLWLRLRNVRSGTSLRTTKSASGNL